MSSITVEAIINGKKETLRGIEAQIYILHGEKAVLNRRKYDERNTDFFNGVAKDRKRNQFTPRRTDKPVHPKGIVEDIYED